MPAIPDRCVVAEQVLGAPRDDVRLPRWDVGAALRAEDVQCPLSADGDGIQGQLRASELARAAGFRRLAVIAAVGTRRYYEARGFERGELYLVKPL